jgi:hypothetical protein
VEIPKTLNQRAAQKLLERSGWVRAVGGKHSVKMEKQGRRPITLLRHHGQQYSAALTRAILR